MIEHECSRGQAERCQNSRSPVCTCACGGWNHGNQAARRKAEREEQEEANVPLVEHTFLVEAGHPRAAFHRDTGGYYLEDDEV